MAIARVGIGAAAGTESNGAALNLVCPATVNANDILIAQVMHTGNSTNPTTPSGWTLLYPDPADITVGAPVGTGTPTARQWIFGKLAIGNEDGTTVSFGTGGGTNGRAGAISSYSGYVSGTLADVVPFASFSDQATETDPAGPTVTTTVAGALAVAYMCQDDNNSHSGITGASGGTWGDYLEFVSSTLGPQGLCLAYNNCTPDADPGIVSGGTLAGTNDESGTIGFEIRPNAPAAPEHDTSGALAGGGSTITGSASSSTARPSSGVLAGGASALAGSAARTRVHAVTGALTGDTAEIAGTAARTRAHPSSGVLATAGAQIVGAAAREGAPVTHATSGALATAGAAIVGAASSATARAASGVLTAGGAAVAGEAARMRAHATQGELAAPGAALEGAAARVGEPVTHATSGVLEGPGAIVIGLAQGPLVDELIDGSFGLVEMPPMHRTPVRHETAGWLTGKGARMHGTANVTRTGQNTMAILLISV